MAEQFEVVAWQARFIHELAAWNQCSKQHFEMVKFHPEEWPGYEVRELYAATQPVSTGMHFTTPGDLAAALDNVLGLHELSTGLIAEEIFKPVSAVPGGYALIPTQVHLDADDIESICSQCGDGGHIYGEFTGGILWVGSAEDDDNNPVYGLHISTSDYPEEGCITLAKFDEAQPTTAATVDDLVMQIRRLVHSLKNHHPDSTLARQVSDYMRNKGYWKATDCLRSDDQPLRIDESF